MNCTRLDIAYAVSRLNRYMSNPSIKHWTVIMRALRYLRYTWDYRLHYTTYPSVHEGYNDATWIYDIKDLKSISEYVFTLVGVFVS